MLTSAQQKNVIDLVKGTKSLIYREMEAAKVTVKGAANYVTNVDFAVQDYLTKELSKSFPEILMIAEEKENEELPKEGTYWILDPIDGTANLIRHYGISAVSLGFYENGEITFGVVYNPFREELFYAAKGQGAYFNDERIYTADTPDFGDAIVSYGSSPYEKDLAKNLFAIFYRIFMKCGDFRRTGSAALDMCYVACGRQHAYFEQNLKPWDYAAGTVILQEAGGIASRWNGEKLPFLKNSDVLASASQFGGIMKRLIAGKE